MSRRHVVGVVAAGSLVVGLAFVGGFALAREAAVTRATGRAFATLPRATFAAAARRGRPAGRRLEGSSLLLVTLAGLRADTPGCLGGDPEATPSLDRLAAGGTRFARAWAASPSLEPSLRTVLALPGPERPPAAGAPPRRSLAEVLAAAGARTETIAVAGPAPPWATAGFEEVHADVGPEELAGQVAALREASLGGGAWLLWVHLPGPAAAVDPAAPPEAAREAYGRAVRETDALLGSLLEAVEPGPRDVVAVVSLHGTVFEESGPAGARDLAPGATRVPVVAQGPEDQPAGQVVRGAVGLADLPATLLDLVGAPSREVGGQSLVVQGVLAPAGRRLVVTTGSAGDGVAAAATWGRLRLVLPGPGAEPALYDDVADPAGLRDLAADRPELVERMRERLESVLSARDPT